MANRFRKNKKITIKTAFLNPNLEAANDIIGNNKTIEKSGSIYPIGAPRVIESSTGIFVTGSGGIHIGPDVNNGFVIDFQPSGSGKGRVENEDFITFTRIEQGKKKVPVVLSDKGGLITDQYTNTFTGSDNK